jgi:hypothetical protein
MTSRPSKSRRQRTVKPAIAWVLFVIALAFVCAVGTSATGSAPEVELARQALVAPACAAAYDRAALCA